MAITFNFQACVLVSFLAARAQPNKAGICADGEQCNQAVESKGGRSLLQYSRSAIQLQDSQKDEAQKNVVEEQESGMEALKELSKADQFAFFKDRVDAAKKSGNAVSAEDDQKEYIASTVKRYCPRVCRDAPQKAGDLSNGLRNGICIGDHDVERGCNKERRDSFFHDTMGTSGRNTDCTGCATDPENLIPFSATCSPKCKSCTEKYFYPHPIFGAMCMKESLWVSADVIDCSGCKYDWRLCDSQVEGNLIDGLRYSEVIGADDNSGKKLDLEIKISDAENSDYKGKEKYNGKDECFGLINLHAGVAVTLDFNFYEHGTSTPYTLHNIFFSVLDLDSHKKKESVKERVTFNTPVTSFTTTASSELEESGSNDDGTLTYTSTERGTVNDNPTDPHAMTPQQQDRTVRVEYADASTFRVTFEIITGDVTVDAKKASRSFMFAGLAF